MQIILDSTLTKTSWSDFRFKASLDAVSLARQIYQKIGDKNHKLISSTGGLMQDGTFQLGFLGLLSQSYSGHEKIEIAPHDIWYLILNEIAIIIKGNAEQCRSLFTKSSGMVDIAVPVDDPTKIDLSKVVNKLRDLIPVGVDIFIPTLSTSTPDSQIAMYAALCDGVSPYYNYITFCCGIPEIRLTGTTEDWDALLNAAGTIAQLFESAGVTAAVRYLARVADVLINIRASFESVNLDFWKSIFTTRNVGSGRQLEITGWITELYFEKRSVGKLENYQTALSIVKYTNLDTGKRYKGVHGPFSQLRTEDDFLKAGYGSLTFEEI